MADTVPEIIEYEGKHYRLMPSTGKAICSKTGKDIHHSEDCQHLRGGDQSAWQLYEDPDGLTWRRLLDSAPSNNRDGRREFARAHGLLNGVGRPITDACDDCVLKEVSMTDDGRPIRMTLAEALTAFDRSAIADEVAKATAEIERVRQEFPLTAWADMPLERYALGVSDYRSTFCYQMEYGTRELGGIGGGSARKHMIFRQKKDQRWYHDPAFANEQDAWAHLRQGFLDAFALAEKGQVAAVDGIEALRSGPSLTAKTLYVYIPDRMLPVYGREHVRHFISLLSDEDPSKLEPFEAHALLKQLIDETGHFSGWHSREIAHFLYWWNSPRQNAAIVKIAPGPDAKCWQDCLTGGYICVGWDDVGDLTAYTSEDDFLETFRAVYGKEYNSNQAKITTKARELWRLTQLQPGDLIVANKGTREVLAVGHVTKAGYAWREDRTAFRHIVAVNWDTFYAQTLPEAEKHWGVVTVASVPVRLWKIIRAGAGAAKDPAPVRGNGMKMPQADPQLSALAKGLARKGQLVLFGPPGTGKTYTSLRFAAWWLSQELGLESEPDPDGGSLRRTLAELSRRDGRPAGHLTQVTFHPAYGYEDFIEGFRPVEDGSSGLRLSLVDGVFKRICRAAEQDPGQPYLLLIDEINRGDVPKIFGELITLLEKDKRGLTVVLPQSGEDFSVPSNVHMLGTMNTADRSIRLLDSALRRRFAFEELLPDVFLLQGAFVGKLNLGDLLSELNRRVLKELGRERQIGHSFFLLDGEPVQDEATLAAVVRNEVLPLLQEYAYDDYSMLARFLGSEIVDVIEHRINDVDDEKLIDALYAELLVDAGLR
ncbi:McrB family protein [Streptosporangium roseum]|uniref:GTPase subunit of restriction endonuclease-like protein n=1 Tax=Streptosporangium roseum (strain ATCC 12428 / DSM 43021 / JCM 3005 / KCTC 9067 / NCIMB 10171 / NRRL 2505 / NI 9100) TaxID=479432 RepID=D2B1B7_STRRD|nr:AAA family ATPase [Streptosporangium roseum]ACZ85382.1 GTPase subunit of restriction endonuclease-like protein [Streptosporangium roseum DSM 43021]